MVIWWLCISRSGETETFDILSWIWSWRSQSIFPLNDKDLNSGIFHIWCKFGNPCLSGLWVIVPTNFQTINWVELDFKVEFDLESQGRLLPNTIGTLTKVFSIFGPNLVILAWTGPELSRGQASDWYTDTQTYRCRQRHYPQGENWPRVTMLLYVYAVCVYIWFPLMVVFRGFSCALIAIYHNSLNVDLHLILWETLVYINITDRPQSGGSKVLHRAWKWKLS